MLMSDGAGVKALSGEWRLLFSRFEAGQLGDHEVIRGALRAPFHPGHPELERILESWDGRHFLAPTEEGSELVLIRAFRDLPSPAWGLHGFLLLLTLFTTLMAGGLLVGIDALHAEGLEVGGAWLPVPTTVDWPLLLRGWPFAATLMGILLAHELGHYVAARVHGVRVTPPFFIPFPAYYCIVGTLGAFIRLRGPLARRSMLLDVGAAGPWASFLLSVPALVWGLAQSSPVPGSTDALAPFVIRFAGEPIWIGASLVAQAAGGIFFGETLGGRPILLHPVAFAGWVGLFVTALNLLPFGQLDGGHVLHALVGSRQRWAGYLFLVSLIPLGFLWWGWWLWGGAAVLLSRGRIRHPPVLQESVPLGPGRRRLARATILVFFATFPPLPLAL